MTAQLPDSVDIDGTAMSVAGVSSPPLFDPADHDLNPSAIGSACWRGYVCEFRVIRDELLLANLLLGSKTELRGHRLAVGDELFGRRISRPTESWLEGSLWVAEIDQNVAYTGGLLVADGFIMKTYVHMGFHPAWKYERVFELIFDGGRLTERIDRSEEMARMRARVSSGEQPDPDGQRGGLGWVERTFSLDYSRSTG